MITRLWHMLTYPYEAWRHRIFMQGWQAGYSDCENGHPATWKG